MMDEDGTDPDLELFSGHRPLVRDLRDLDRQGHLARNEAENARDILHLTALLARPAPPPAPVPGWRCGKPHCTKCVSPTLRKPNVRLLKGLP